MELTELRVSRAQPEDGTESSCPIIEGHAAVFNQWSENLGGIFPFKEKVIPGAFRDSINVDDVRALFNHDPNYVLGRNKAGTLELKETQKGLLVRVTPPDTQWARDLTVSIDRGDISQMSFGFLVEDDKWGTEEGMDVRELHKVKLFDVSPVTFPAYPQTSVGVRSMTEVYEARKLELETDVNEQKAKAQAALKLLENKLKLL